MTAIPKETGSTILARYQTFLKSVLHSIYTKQNNYNLSKFYSNINDREQKKQNHFMVVIQFLCKAPAKPQPCSNPKQKTIPILHHLSSFNNTFSIPTKTIEIAMSGSMIPPMGWIIPSLQTQSECMCNGKCCLPKNISEFSDSKNKPRINSTWS